MTMTDIDNAPPPTASEPTLEERVHALGVTADRLAADLVEERAKSAAVIRDRDRLLRLNVTLDALCRRELAKRDDDIRHLRQANESMCTERDSLLAEVLRHRRAAEACAAIEDAKAARRPLNAREHLFATLAVLGIIGVACGALTAVMPLFVGGLALAGLSGAALLLCRNAVDPERPFDLDEAVDRA